MPKNTKVHHCVDDVKRKGKDEGSAIAICQASTHQSYHTGKKKRKDGKPVGSKHESFERRLSRALNLIPE